MTINQVHTVAVVVLFLGSVLTALWGAEIAGALGGAWARGTAQAAAEKRRLATAAREARESGTWQQARAAARGMRGAAQGAGAWARKENGPARRILAAAATGAYVGAKGAARAAAGARRRQAAGGWRRPGGSSRPAPTTGSRFRPRRHLGVCDGCGVTVARRSLKGNRCVRCRGPEKWRYGTPPRQAPVAAPAAVPVPAGNASVPPAPAVPLPSGGDGASAGTVPGVQPNPQLPAPQSTSGQVPVAVQSAPTGGAALMPPGTPAVGYRRPASAVVARPGGTGVLEGRVVGRPGTAVAVRPVSSVAIGDATTHGEWVANVEIVILSLARLFAFAKQMTNDLTAKDGPDNLITDVDRWADQIGVYGRKILADLLLIDENLAPYINAVMDLGGPAQVASPEWHEEY